MTKLIGIASDHAGLELKAALIRAVQEFDFYVADCIDLGTFDEESVDYPDYANALADIMLTEDDMDFGILICGSGIGISIAANRHSHVRCALVEDSERAGLAREHNDANVIAFGARFITAENAIECLRKFLQVEFSAGRHQKRVDLLTK